MRNKLLKNNQSDYISKGGVLYRAGEIPILTKEQIVQANLVSKLPRDFPFAKWEGMSTKQQLREMKSSGLNDQDQWSLLNSNVPLAVLNEHNQAQDQATAQASVAKVIAPLAARVVQSSAQRTPVTNAITSKSTALQKSTQQRQLEERNEKFLTKHLVKQPTNNPSQKNTADLIRSPQSYKPIERLNDSSDKGGDNGEPTSLWGQFISWLHDIVSPEEKPDPTPQIVTFSTNAPSPTPVITPTPKPTPKPSPTPTAMPTESEQRAQAAVKKGMGIADLGVKYKLGGKKTEDGLDCSGLVVIELQEAGFIFGEGHLSLGAQYMADSFVDNGYGDRVYIYTENNVFPQLQAGDLVFSANTKDLSVNEHVTMATGDGLQVVEASSVAGAVTYQFDAYKTHENGKYYRASGQVVTEIIRPFY